MSFTQVVPTSLESNSCSIPSKLSFVAHTALIVFDFSLNGVEPPFQLLYILQLWVACWGSLAWRCKTYLEPIHYEDQCSKQDELWLSISSGHLGHSFGLKVSLPNIINFAKRDDISSTLCILTFWIVDHIRLTKHPKECHTLSLYCMALKVYFFCLLSIYNQKMILHWFHFQPHQSWQYWEILER